PDIVADVVVIPKISPGNLPIQYKYNHHHHHHHLRFTSILSIVDTKARVRRYQLLLDFNCSTTDCGLNESRMPFRLYCILLFDSVMESVRIQNHYHGIEEQTGGHA